MTEQSPSPDKRRETLNIVVDTVLNQILGQEATQIIYNYLENKHSIRRHEIGQKLDSFNRVLEEYLGPGAFVIEKVIMENLSLHGFEENKSIESADNSKILKLA